MRPTMPSSRPGASGPRCATRRASSRGSIGILVNTCRDRLRSTRWQARDISTEVAVVSGDPFRQAHDRDVLGTAIAALSPDHRVVVALRYYLDLTVDDIASRLGIPTGTVHSRLHYALKQLHDTIDADDAKGTFR